MKKLKDPEDPLERILGRARNLGPHLGPVLYQLPPQWRCDFDRLRAFIACLPMDLQHVVEFRDLSWCIDQVRDVLTETGISLCIHDSHGIDWPAWVTGPIVYVRFHGPRVSEVPGRYSRSHLRRWAERVRAFQEEGRDIYAYFNNDRDGHAVTNARELLGMLGLQPAATSSGSDLFTSTG
jgi:uncharacterized protein YecE (DUF72 family)